MCAGFGLKFGILMVLGIMSGSWGFDLPSYPLQRSDGQDYEAGVNYNEYRVVIPRQQMLMLLRRLLASQRPLEDGGSTSYESRPESNYRNNAPTAHRRTYRSPAKPQQVTTVRYAWRQCYHNPVSCFKK